MGTPYRGGYAQQMAQMQAAWQQNQASGRISDTQARLQSLAGAMQGIHSPFVPDKEHGGYKLAAVLSEIEEERELISRLGYPEYLQHRYGA